MGGWNGEGNFDLDPRFVNPAAVDYRLRQDSPCRDTGLNDSLPSDITDLSGNGNRTERLPRDLLLQSRIEGTTVDIGAFEWHP